MIRKLSKLFSPSNYQAPPFSEKTKEHIFTHTTRKKRSLTKIKNKHLIGILTSLAFVVVIGYNLDYFKNIDKPLVATNDQLQELTDQNNDLITTSPTKQEESSEISPNLQESPTQSSEIQTQEAEKVDIQIPIVDDDPTPTEQYISEPDDEVYDEASNKKTPPEENNDLIQIFPTDKPEENNDLIQIFPTDKPEENLEYAPSIINIQRSIETDNIQETTTSQTDKEYNLTLKTDGDIQLKTNNQITHNFTIINKSTTTILADTTIIITCEVYQNNQLITSYNFKNNVINEISKDASENIIHNQNNTNLTQILKTKDASTLNFLCHINDNEEKIKQKFTNTISTTQKESTDTTNYSAE